MFSNFRSLLQKQTKPLSFPYGIRNLTKGNPGRKGERGRTAYPTETRQIRTLYQVKAIWGGEEEEKSIGSMKIILATRSTKNP